MASTFDRLSAFPLKLQFVVEFISVFFPCLPLIDSHSLIS